MSYRFQTINFKEATQLNNDSKFLQKVRDEIRQESQDSLVLDDEQDYDLTKLKHRATLVKEDALKSDATMDLVQAVRDNDYRTIRSWYQ